MKQAVKADIFLPESPSQNVVGEAHFSSDRITLTWPGGERELALSGARIKRGGFNNLTIQLTHDEVPDLMATFEDKTPFHDPEQFADRDFRNQIEEAMREPSALREAGRIWLIIAIFIVMTVLGWLIWSVDFILNLLWPF